MRLVVLAVALLTLSVMNLASGAYASGSEIVIVDSDNITRATAVVEETGVIELTIIDENGMPADGFDVLLTNVDTGDILIRTAINGITLFEEVPPGVWEVSSSVDWAKFSNVGIAGTVEPAMAGGMTGAAGLALSKAGLIAVGGSAAVGGTVAIAASDSSDSDGGSAKNPFPPATPQPTQRPGPYPTPKPTATPVPTPTPTPVEPSPYQ